MVDVPVYDTTGNQIETLSVDEQRFGGRVNAPLLKQAIVAYHANGKRGTAQTRSRGMVEGSTRKLYRQKGTGYARRGTLRTVIMRGGGVAFAKKPIPPRKRMPRKMRRAALHSALLAKMIGGDLLVLQGLEMDTPRTAALAKILKSLGIDRSCLLAIADRDRNVYLSGRNLEDLTVRTVDELNAFDVANRQKMILTREAVERLLAQEAEA